MVMIRLARGGAVRRPFYHIVVTNRRSRRDGRNIERLGFYNPVATGQETELKIDLERVDYWLSQGAKPSETVARLLKSYRKAQAEAA